MTILWDCFSPCERRHEWGNSRLHWIGPFSTVCTPEITPLAWEDNIEKFQHLPEAVFLWLCIKPPFSWWCSTSSPCYGDHQTVGKEDCQWPRGRESPDWENIKDLHLRRCGHWLLSLIRCKISADDDQLFWLKHCIWWIASTYPNAPQVDSCPECFAHRLSKDSPLVHIWTDSSYSPPLTLPNVKKSVHRNKRHLDGDTPLCHTRRQTADHLEVPWLLQSRWACKRSSRRPGWTSWCCQASGHGGPSCCPWKWMCLLYKAAKFSGYYFRLNSQVMFTWGGSSLRRDEKEQVGTRPKRFCIIRSPHKFVHCFKISYLIKPITVFRVVK